VSTIVDFCNLAAAQVGVPYVFGGTSLKGSASPGLDCSGLPYAVSLALGETIPRTSEAQFAGLTKIPAPQRRGDLVFYNVPTDNQPQPAHEAIWWSPTQVLQAPHTGEDVMFSAPLPFEIMGYASLPFPNAPQPPPEPTTEEMTEMGLAIAQNGDAVSTWIGKDGTNAAGHAFVMTQKAGTLGQAPTSANTSIIDVTATWPFFQVQEG
jgi:hypothetical protein